MPEWKRPTRASPRQAVGESKQSGSDDRTLEVAVQRTPTLSIVDSSSTSRGGAAHCGSRLQPCCCWQGDVRASASCIACARWRRVLHALDDRKRRYKRGVAA